MRAAPTSEVAPCRIQSSTAAIPTRPREYLGDFLLPTLIGNTVGGVSLVAALNHAQVTSGGGKTK